MELMHLMQNIFCEKQFVMKYNVSQLVLRSTGTPLTRVLFNTLLPTFLMESFPV